MKEKFQELWPNAKVDVRDDAWSINVELTSQSDIYVSFGQLMKVAAIFDTDKFEVKQDSETHKWQISEVTWDSTTSYTATFYVRHEFVGEWSKPELKKFANEFVYEPIS